MQRKEAEQFGELLRAARAGCRDSENELIDRCRNYLLLIANADLDTSLQRKVGASDVVQETLIKARSELDAFRGSIRRQDSQHTDDGKGADGDA